MCALIWTKLALKTKKDAYDESSRQHAREHAFPSL